MATQTLEANATTGLTITGKLFALEGDTVIQEVSGVERTNDKGRYRFAFIDVPAGAYRLNGFVGSVGGFINEVYDLTLATDVFLPRSEANSQHVISMAANTLTASALASDAVTEIQSGLATSAALAVVDAITDKLDATLESDGAGGWQFTTLALENGPSGSSSINVLPLQGTVDARVTGTNITLFTEETPSVSVGVVDANGTAVVITGKTLEIIFENMFGADVATIANASITKTGSTATFTIPSAVTATQGDKRWAMRDTSDGSVLVRGVVQVAYAAQGD